jgi:hypothetical protein
MRNGLMVSFFEFFERSCIISQSSIYINQTFYLLQHNIPNLRKIPLGEDDDDDDCDIVADALQVSPLQTKLHSTVPPPSHPQPHLNPTHPLRLATAADLSPAVPTSLVDAIMLVDVTLARASVAPRNEG